MADQNVGASAGQPAAPPATAPQPGAPTDFKVPEGHRLVKNEDWDSTSRLAETGRGARPYFEAGKSLGFEKPDDFKAWSPAFQALKQRGLTPTQISQMFGEKALEDEGGQRGNGQQIDPARIKSEILSDVKREAAENAWRSGVDTEGDLISGGIKDLESIAPVKGSMLERAFKFALEEARGFYPDEHPLSKTHQPPLTKQTVGKIVEAFKAEWTKEKAASLSDKANTLRSEDRQRRTPTTAAPNTGSGKADDKPGKVSNSSFVKDALREVRQEIGA